MPTKDDKKQIEEQSQWALDKEREFIPAEWRPLSEAAALRVWQCQRAGRPRRRAPPGMGDPGPGATGKGHA